MILSETPVQTGGHLPEHTEEEQIKNRRAAQLAAKKAQIAKGAAGRQRVVRGESDLEKAGRARRTRATEASAASDRAVADAARVAKEAIQADNLTGIAGARQDLTNRQATIERLIEGQTTNSNNDN